MTDPMYIDVRWKLGPLTAPRSFHVQQAWFGGRARKWFYLRHWRFWRAKVCQKVYPNVWPFFYCGSHWMVCEHTAFTHKLKNAELSLKRCKQSRDC